MAQSRSSVAVGFALLALSALIVASSAAAPQPDTRASLTTITRVDGTVLVRRGEDLVAAREGDVLSVGDVIRAGVGSSAEITYFEGSSVNLWPASDLVIGTLAVERDAAVWSALGRTWTVVTKLVNGVSRYPTRGPSGTASVRG